MRQGWTAVGLGMPPVRLTEPTAEQRQRYHAWLARHRDELGRAWAAAEDLSRAYDRAAVVTSADGNPEVPPYFRLEIDVHYSRWETTRWAGRNHS